MSDELESVFSESEAKPAKLFKSKFGFMHFFENGFGAILISKTNILSIWKGHFSEFCKYLRAEVWIIFCESEGIHWKLFKSKFGYRKLLRKWFWSNLELKNACCEFLKRVFSRFLQIFESRTSNHFLGKWGKLLKNV